MTIAAITLGLKYGPSVVAAVYSAIHFHWARKQAKKDAQAKGAPPAP